MNGAEALVRTLLAGGVDTCFANPGTSEMHMVAALDRIPGMRCVLALAEGVVTGAADGYARMADRPACTLLHCGPGLANALANLHNAKRARTPIVNVVGDHATYHVQHDAPLGADVEGVARPFSAWIRTSVAASQVALDGAAAISAARSAPGRVATLILPADTAWSDAGEAGPAPVPPPVPPRRVPAAEVEAAARTLRSGRRIGLMVGGAALRGRALEAAGRIAAATGAKLFAPTSNARMSRGAGRVAVDRVPYPIDMSLAFLGELEAVVLVGARQPVGFFAYPGKPGVLTPPGCAAHHLARPEDDAVQALLDLEDALGLSGAPVPTTALSVPDAPPAGPITPEALAAALAHHLPEDAVVVDEGITAGWACWPATVGARPHDWLQLTGGSIGIGIPLATGAAVGAPGRRVVGLQADGSAMYTLQGLWTQAREGLDVTTVILNNRSYAILEGEFRNVGALGNGKTALSMMSLADPAISWADLAKGMGVPGVRVTDAAELSDALARSLATPGPMLIDAWLG